jgi:hypothetical protein
MVQNDNLKLVGVGQVGKGDPGNGDKGSQTASSDQSRFGLLFAALCGNFHFWLNGPDIRLSILINRNTALLTTFIFFSKDNSSGSKCCS